MISHEHKAIFVHIPKTGGQSIEQMFLDDLGLSWEERGLLTLAPNEDREKGPSRLAHLYAHEYVSKGFVTRAQWDQYLTFAVVRNPYERILSVYLYRHRGGRARLRLVRGGSDLKKFVERRCGDDFNDLNRHLLSETRYLCDQQGNIMVDHVIGFENMRPEIERLLANVLKSPAGMPHRNKTPGVNRYLKERARRTIKPLVAASYQSDFTTFGYPM